jgi:hypothetical protein
MRLDADRLPMEALPSRSTRWIPRRKAAVVKAVTGGLLTIEQACERYELTLEEFASWRKGIEREGLAGLEKSRIQYYRNRRLRMEDW